MLNVQVNDTVSLVIDLEQPSVGMGEGLIKLTDGLSDITVPYKLQSDVYTPVTKLAMATAINNCLLDMGYALRVSDIHTQD